MSWMSGPEADLDGDARVEELLADASRIIGTAPAVSRVRPAVAEAWARSQAGRDRHGNAGPAGPARSNRARLPLRARLLPRAHAVIRPVLAGGFALALATGSVAASTTPGAPLYTTRLAVEQALLPGPGSARRADAEADYADRRLGEARDAMAKGDRTAAIAALRAFSAGIRELAVEGLPAPEAEALRDRLATDARTLALMRSRSTDPTSAGVLAEAAHEVEDLEDPGTTRAPRDRADATFSPDTRRQP